MIRAAGEKKYKGQLLPRRDTGIQDEGPAVTETQKLVLHIWPKKNRYRKVSAPTPSMPEENPPMSMARRDSLERAAARSYFAIQTFMDELETPGRERFE